MRVCEAESGHNLAPLYLASRDKPHPHVETRGHVVVWGIVEKYLAAAVEKYLAAAVAIIRSINTGSAAVP